MKFTALLLLLLGTCCIAFAQPPVPEINPGSAGSALALLSGALLMIRARRK